MAAPSNDRKKASNNDRRNIWLLVITTLLVIGSIIMFMPPQEKINQGLREMAESGENMFFVDCNAPFCDGEGYLLNKVSRDGEHLTPEYTAQWAQEILARAIIEMP
jgi:hypothetical protein